MKESLYDHCIATGKEALLEQWYREKNGGATPQNVTPQSNRKMWWKCGKGHNWEATVGSRVRGAGCPICSNKVVLAGENDLATTHPHLAAQWNYEKNGALTPQQFPHGTLKKVWWRCDKGHEWEACINGRARGAGCPVCAGQTVVPGDNDFATAFPELAAQWHSTKNGELRPQDVAPFSSSNVWWICESGHEWQASVINRARLKTGCPYCIGRKAIAGVNDLVTMHPEIAAEWHPELNGKLTPQTMMSGSHKQVWWRCENGHAWQATVANRTKNKTGCPYCAGKKAIAGINDLVTMHPQIAAEWHPELNGNLTPQMMLSGSYKQVWWRCENGHEWQETVVSRTRRKKAGCPICAKSMRARRKGQG